jgi:hypothetical protein
MHRFMIHYEQKFAIKHADVSKKVRVRPNQGCPRKRAGRSQQGVNCKSKEREKGGTLFPP